MSESYKSGSVRGVRSNAHPYRDNYARHRCSVSSLPPTLLFAMALPARRRFDFFTELVERLGFTVAA